jgi:hypothetical protein
MAMSGPQHAHEANELLKKAKNAQNATTKTNLLLEAQVHLGFAQLAAAVHLGPSTEKERNAWVVHGVRV